MSAYLTFKKILGENKLPVYNVRAKITLANEGIRLRPDEIIMNEKGLEFAVMSSLPGSAVVLAKVAAVGEKDAADAVVEALKGEVYQDAEIHMISSVELVYAGRA